MMRRSLSRARERVGRWAAQLQRRRQFARASQRPQEGGFTLVEIMVVVTIIGLLVGTVSVVAFSQLKKAKVKNTKTIIVNVESAVQLYMMENNDDCPASLEELHAQKILRKPPVDAWSEPLIFSCPGERNADGFDIASKGPDKKEGTSDDITNFDSGGQQE
jgi:general secretion pathway protein G